MKIKRTQTTLLIRTKDVVFPIDSIEFINTLSKNGYQITARPPPSAPVGTMLEIYGEVARKTGASVEIDGEKKHVLIRGNESNTVISVFLDVLSIVKYNLSVDLEKNVLFYEGDGFYHIQGEKSPLETISKTESDVHLSLGKLFGISQVSPFSIHLFSTGSKVNSVNWFDMSIKPLLPNQTETTYDLTLVLRTENKSNLLNILEGIEQKMSKVIEILEQKST